MCTECYQDNSSQMAEAVGAGGAVSHWRDVTLYSGTAFSLDQHENPDDLLPGVLAAHFAEFERRWMDHEECTWCP